MKRCNRPIVVSLLLGFCLALPRFIIAADATGALLGSWTGKATGPEGGPPTGALNVSFQRRGCGLEGNVTVKGAGGLQYRGTMSEITLKNRVLSAKAIFTLGQNVIEALLRGPLKGRTIHGKFRIFSSGQTMGQGTFSLTKDTQNE